MSDLVSATNYKTYAGISGSTYDSVLAILTAAISAQVRRACGRDETTGFETGTKTEKYDGEGTEILQLIETPITSITSVASIADDGSSTTLASTDYRCNLKNGQLFRIGATTGRFAGSWSGGFSPEADACNSWATSPCWVPGFQNYTVVYVGGYSTIPSDLQLACYRLIDLAFKGRGNPYQSESIGDYSYTLGSQAEQDETFRTLIGPFMVGGA